FVPSFCWDTPTSWNRSARLADAPPMESAVVDRTTTKPGKALLRPGLVPPAVRGVAFNKLASLALKARSTRMPVPPVPWMESGSGENTWPVTGWLDVVEVVLFAAAFFLEPPEEQAARAREATSVYTSSRLMGKERYM